MGYGTQKQTKIKHNTRHRMESYNKKKKKKKKKNLVKQSLTEINKQENNKKGGRANVTIHNTNNKESTKKAPHRFNHLALVHTFCTIASTFFSPSTGEVVGGEGGVEEGEGAGWKKAGEAEKKKGRVRLKEWGRKGREERRRGVHLERGVLESLEKRFEKEEGKEGKGVVFLEKKWWVGFLVWVERERAERRKRRGLRERVTQIAPRLMVLAMEAREGSKGGKEEGEEEEGNNPGCEPKRKGWSIEDLKEKV